VGVGRAKVSPSVSVIVPVRDRRALLSQLLEALAAQTFADHEVIVVDDRSTDGSREEAVRHAAMGQPVVVIDGPGTGAVSARTVGVALARAPVLAFTDSDCVPDPRWLEEGLAAIERGADLVQGRTHPTRHVRPRERSMWVDHEDGLYASCNLFVRRQAFDAAGGFDSEAAGRLRFRVGGRAQGLGFGEDTLLGWRVRTAGTTAFADAAVVGHEVLPSNGLDALSRAVLAGAFPALLREVPELGPLLLRRGVFLGRTNRVAILGAMFALAARRPLLAAGLAAVWIVPAARRIAAAEPGWVERARALGIELGLDAVTGAALVVGSARAKRLVL